MNSSPFIFPPQKRIFTVNTYADLPAPAAKTDEYYFVLFGTGLWPFNRRSPGLYYSDGISWIYTTEITQAFNVSMLTLYDDSDHTKQLQFDLSALPSTSLTTFTFSPIETDTEALASSNAIYNFPVNPAVIPGSFVYMSSSGIADFAKADDVSTSAILGVVVYKITTNTAKIITSGLTPEIFSGLIKGTEYFLSPFNFGEITAIVPSSTGNVIAPLGIAVSETQLFINITNRRVRA